MEDYQVGVVGGRQVVVLATVFPTGIYLHNIIVICIYFLRNVEEEQ